MNGNLGRDKVWNQQIWDDIDHAVRDEMGRIRVAQKVFPCMLLPDGELVQADKLGSGMLNIEEGKTKPLVEIWAEFTLSQSQVDSEARLHTGRTLARMAASRLATAEDMLLFQGKTQAVALLKSKGIPLTNAGIQERNAAYLGNGFLGEAADSSLKTLKTGLDEATDLPLSHKGGADLKRQVRAFTNLNAANKGLSGALRDELNNIIKGFPEPGDAKALTEKLNTILRGVPVDDKFKDLKERLENIAKEVPYHPTATKLKEDLDNIPGIYDPKTKLIDVSTELFNLAHRMPDYVAGHELKSELKDIARSVSAEITVKCWKGGKIGEELDPKKLIEGILDGIKQLTSNAQTGPYALFVPPGVFAKAAVPTSANFLVPADRITPLVTGGYYGTGCLKDDEQGLLVSLGGEPSTIYMGDDATAVFTQVEANGTYRFRVFERFQFVVREPRALVKLEFSIP
jgi:uncharacterized linocin/CFP29 family protein